MGPTDTQPVSQTGASSPSHNPISVTDSGRASLRASSDTAQTGIGHSRKHAALFASSHDTTFAHTCFGNWKDLTCACILQQERSKLSVRRALGIPQPKPVQENKKGTFPSGVHQCRPARRAAARPAVAMETPDLGLITVHPAPVTAGRVQWCEPESLLHSVFGGFSHLPQPKLRHEAACVSLGTMLSTFASNQGDATLKQAAVVVAGEPGAPHHVTWFPEYGAACLALGSTGAATCPVGMLHVFVVGLDDWEYKVHSTSDGNLHPTASCTGHTLLSVGTVPSSAYQTFVGAVHSIEAEWRRQHDEKQQKQQQLKGFHRTPDFIHGVAQDALDEVLAAARNEDSNAKPHQVTRRLPEGGFTDVGLHTGHAAARDTAWPLVREVFQVVLEKGISCTTCPKLLFDQAMVHFEVWLLRRQVELTHPTTASPAMLNACMVMLQSAATKASALASEGRDVSALEAECKRIRAALSSVSAQRTLVTALNHEFPGVPCGPDSWQLPKGAVPAAASASVGQDDLAERRKRAAANLGSLPLLLPAGTPLLPAGPPLLAPSLRLLESKLFADPRNDVAAQHLLRSVETELFSRAAAGFSGASGASGAGGLLPLEEVAALERLVGVYRVAYQRFMDSPAAAAVMRVEQHSRQVLVAWIAYCATHAATLEAHPVLKDYGVSLDWQDLKHLVLSDRPAVDAALSVSTYLHAHTKPDWELFSLRGNGPQATLRAALQFAQGDSRHLIALWASEQQDAAARTAAHWKEVRRKQDLVAQLRRQLADLESKLYAAQQVLNSAVESRAATTQYEYIGSRLYHTAAYTRADAHVSSCQSDVSTINSQVATVKGQLKEAGKAPEPVIQPLPSSRDAALQWLFFLHMPPLPRHLSRASFLAQQLLLPYPLDQATTEAIQVAGMETRLVSHYNTHQHSVYHTPSQTRTGTDGATGNVMLVSRGTAPTQVGPSHVDQFTSDSQGVWHPDTLHPEMGWQGSGSPVDQAKLKPIGYFNPFAHIDDRQRVLTFTEQLPAGLEALQWVMPQHGSVAATAAERGNLALSQQDLRPSWLSKPGFLTFCTLRSYPLRQLHRQCVALNDRCLPLGHPAVGTLVRQLLYHLGTLRAGAGQASSGGVGVAQLWRTGWEAADGVLDTLCRELGELAAVLEQAPREHDSVLLLGEMAAYLSTWHPALRPVARRFAAMTSRAADALEEQIGKAAPGDEASRQVLQARQCFLRMLALLCHGGGTALEAGDVAMMVRLMVLINHGHVFMQKEYFQDPTYLDQLSHLRVRCHNVMAGRLRDITRHSSSAPDLLTAAVACVLQRTPSTLPWEGLTVEGAPSASCEAVGKDGHLYSINLLDGTVLLDGLPPSRLPKDVTEHHMFRRTFGEGVNFEVVRTASGVQQTLRPIKGCFYDFFRSASGHLLVRELDITHNCTLELLDAGEDDACGGWGTQLPVRLRKLHSHWICRDQDVTVLRPPNFLQRDHHFVIQGASGAPPGTASGHPSPLQSHVCWRVPLHLHAHHWTQLLHEAADRQQLTDQLVLHESPVKRILSKMEDTQFIHTYLRSTNTFHTNGSNGNGSGSSSHTSLLFELPRFGLEFEQRPDGSLVALDYSGYCLAPRQQLVSGDGAQGSGTEVLYTLPEFEQYLVLQRSESSAVTVGSRRADQLVLVPVGQVMAQRGVAAGAVRVQHSNAVDAKLKCHIYEVHERFGDLRATSVLSRLQLAALYAAAGSLVPEPRSRLTGAQTALALLRQCWGDRPLSPEEAAQLNSVGPLGGHLLPALRLVQHELELSAAHLSYLHTGVLKKEERLQCNVHAVSRYVQEAERLRERGVGSLRAQLTPSEEQRAVGTLPQPRQPPTWQRLGHYKPITVPPCPAPAATTPDYVQGIEQQLTGLVVVPPQPTSTPSYPLSVPGDAGPLEAAMHEELKASWQAHHSTPVPKAVVPGTLHVITQSLGDVRQGRQQVEEWLQQHLSLISDDVGTHGAAFRVLQAADLVPSPSRLDLLRAAWLGDSHLLQFNPFLDPQSCARLRQGVVLWMQLCVLEDRQGRLQGLAESAQQDNTYLPRLIQELLVRRTWDAVQHPQWLAFEVEGRIQIRPQQHWIANHLINNPGAIDQLNMGEGKTRVILPMLALHWADGSCVVRLNFLPTLLDEAYSHLHNVLTASALRRKLFTLPFHRDIQPSEQTAKAMEANLAHCQQEGGLLLVAPQHRLSLQLKWHELRAAGKDKEAVCAALDAVADITYVDILDESDELLHHRFQLVYACGAPVPLPGRQQRAHAAQALLRIISAPTPDIDATIKASGVAVFSPPPGDRPGAFSGLRLLRGEALEHVSGRLQQQLAEALLSNPPYELRWMKDHPLKAHLLRGMTDESQPTDALLTQSLPADQLSQVLAVRGLLAHQLLLHALHKRHAVDYGINRSPTARKRLAVPYRAALTPAERSEFAQPDVALLLTRLSYYNDGLSKDQFLATLLALLRMGESAQQAHYQEWLALSWQGMPAESREPLDNVLKLDPSNSVQLDLLYSVYSHNMAVVDYWLNFCVFPYETHQYPERLVATAWHLVDQAQVVVGFSGTNDNHRLLPLHVKQHMLEEPGLKGTNGKMLDIIQTASYSTLRPVVDGSTKPQWQLLLDTAVQEGLDALLDCGALLAGISGSDASQYLLPLLDARRFKGVCYYDRGWMIRDARGRCMPRNSSPISEREAFVIYDDARCRGADLQLRVDAVGLLTLGPGLCKDKLMQAAGRLRQLGRGQTLRIVGTEDVTAKIRVASTAGLHAYAGSPKKPRKETTSLDVVQWVMANTVASTQQGVLEWAKQGMHYALTKEAPDRARLPELLTLDDFYGGSWQYEAADRVIESMAATTLQRHSSNSGGQLIDGSSLSMMDATTSTLQSHPSDEQLRMADSPNAMAPSTTITLEGPPSPVQHLAAGMASDEQLHDGSSHSMVPTTTTLESPPSPAQHLAAGMAELVERIRSRGTENGHGHQVVARHGADEECERELEQEEEEEQEQEREVPAVDPGKEQDWDYAAALVAGSVQDLSSRVMMVTLDTMASRLQPDSVSNIKWDTQVWATTNFYQTIAGLAPDAPLNEYLRAVDALLVFPRAQQVLLLSEREADALLEVMWTRPPAAPITPALATLTYASEPTSTTLLVPSAANGIAHQPPCMTPHAIASCRLFNGSTSYKAFGGADQPVFVALRGMMRRGSAAEAAEALVSNRGRSSHFLRSDLELACEEVME